VRVLSQLRLGLLVVATMVALADAAGAQSPTIVRVITDDAPITSRLNPRSPVIARALLDVRYEVNDAVGDRYWVMLPPDENGTRRPGWITATDVEIVFAERNFKPFGTAVVGARAPKVEKPKAPKAEDAEAPEVAAAKPPKQEDRRLKKAERDLEAARRRYEEAVSKAGAESGAPDPSAPNRTEAPSPQQP
jgi:hypothetical protein